MIFAVDFDGTIVSHDFPAIGEPTEKALAVLKELQTRGHQIILWTCRDGDYLQQAVDFLTERGFAPDAINDNIDGVSGFAERKVVADYYFDDRSFPAFSGWQSVYETFIKPFTKGGDLI